MPGGSGALVIVDGGVTKSIALGDGEAMSGFGVEGGGKNGDV